MRKIMISAAALATLVAMPALAQTLPPPNEPPMVSEPFIGPGPFAGPGIFPWFGYGAEAYAAVPGALGPTIMQQGAYDCGRYLGSDPDPNVRLQLLRDACSYQGQ